VANELRSEHGPSWIIEQLLEQALAQTHVLRQKSVVIESIRSIGEAQLLKAKGAALWAVDADIHERYRRIVGRASETDAVTFEKFQADEEREMTSTDPNKQNLHAVMAMADAVLTNDGTQEELHAQVEAQLRTLQ